jgi:hypothetical protein
VTSWPVRACVIAASLLAPIGSAYAGTLTLKARAGIGGLGRDGRWAPVDVSLDNTDRPLAGDIVVSWGDAVVRRAITLGSPARADVVVYIRSADIRDRIAVRVESQGTVLQTIDVPIRLAPVDEDVTLCVAASDSAVANDGCAAAVNPAALPRSMWGYDAVDHVRWQGTSPAVLAADQQRAFEQWTAKRTLDEAGVVRTPPRAWPSSDAAGGRAIAVATTVIVFTIALLIAAAVAARHLRRRPLFAYAAIAVVAVLSSAAALAAGTIGPGREIVLTHSSTVHQLPRGGSLVAMHASVWFPTFDAFGLTARSVEAAIEPHDGSRTQMRFGEAGEPMLSGTFGTASRHDFALDGVVSFSPYRIKQRTGAVTITNASTFDYRDCYVSDGLSRDAAGNLRAGQTIRVASASTFTAFISCTLPATPVEFTESRYPVDVGGSTDVIAYLNPSTAAGAR